MPHQEGNLEIDPFTEGLSKDDLAALATRHGVRYEIGANQLVKPGGVQERHGWMLDLYGSRSKDDQKLEGETASHHVHDVLRAIARVVAPSHIAEALVHKEPYNGSVFVDPHKNFLEEVRLRIVIEPGPDDHTPGTSGPVANVVEEMRKKLSELGVKQG